MGIWERLGNVIKSYLNDEEPIRKSPYGAARHGDPDLDAAYEELDDFLRGKDTQGKGGDGRRAAGESARPVPPELRQDFAELGLTPQASARECKEAYKKLLKIHHPDRHAKHQGNMKKATEKTARVNAAYRRIEEWFQLSSG